MFEFQVCYSSYFLCHVSMHFLVVHWLEDVVFTRTVVVTGTCLNEHHHLLHEFTIGALELYWKGGSSVRGAATTISADATELGPVSFGSCTTREFKLHWLGNLWGANTPFTLLNVFLQMCLTWPDNAQSCLFFQPACSVVIGYPGRDAHATGLWTGAPFSGLYQTVGSHHGGIRTIGLLLSVCCKGWSNHSVLSGLITNPLVTTFARDLDFSWKGAVRARKTNIYTTKRHTANCSIKASALVFAAALECFSTSVDQSSKYARNTILSCAHPYISDNRGAKITKQSLVVITGVLLSADLTQLLGTHFTTTASILYQTDSSWALRRIFGAITPSTAYLGSHQAKQQQQGGKHLSGSNSGNHVCSACAWIRKRQGFYKLAALESCCDQADRVKVLSSSIFPLGLFSERRLLGFSSFWSCPLEG